MDLEYIEIDGLLYPNIETGMEEIENDLSRYGILRLRYLHEHKRGMYRELLLTGKLAEHCTNRKKLVWWLFCVDYLATPEMPVNALAMREMLILFVFTKKIY